MTKIAPIGCVCLVCGAVPGMPCTGASGKTLKTPHLWRKDTAADANRDHDEDNAIVESLRRQSEFYAANPRVDAQPEWDDR